MSYSALNDRLEEFSGKLYCFFLTINEVIEQERKRSGKPASRITFSTFHATLTLETLKIYLLL